MWERPNQIYTKKTSQLTPGSTASRSETLDSPINYERFNAESYRLNVINWAPKVKKYPAVLTVYRCRYALGR